MNEKKCKTREEWKKLFLSLTPEAFEGLCYDIINNNNFRNLIERGCGGDGGRDLEADFVYKITNEEVIEKCWFQCKRQDTGINFKQFSTEVQKAEDQNVKKFFIISNTDTTPACKDDIKNWNNKHKCQVIDSSGSKFLDLLFQLPDVCRYYFPDEEIPPIIDARTPENMIELYSDLGKQLGIKLEFKMDKQVNLNNPSDVADRIKESLLSLKGIDTNILALIFQKISMFFFSIGKSEDAIMFLNKSLDTTPKNIEALLNKGYILEKLDDVKESTRCYDKILEIDANNKFALNNIAHNLWRTGKLDAALKFIDKALDVDPNFIVAIITKIEILKGLKKSKDALTFLNEKDDLLHKSIHLQTSKADLCIDMLDLKEAYKINEELLKKDPNNIDVINNKGVIFEKNSRFQRREKYLSLALEWFEKVIQKDSKYPLGWSNKVVVLMQYGKINDAEKSINTAYTLFPKNAYILNKAGVVLLRKNKPKDALKYFDKALKIWFKEEFLLNVAQAQIILRRWEDAKRNAEKILKYNPEKSEAWAIKSVSLKHLRQPGVKTCIENAKKFIEKPMSLLE